MCKLVTSFKVLDIAKICLLRKNTLAYFILGLNDEQESFMTLGARRHESQYNDTQHNGTQHNTP
jgi:hypothetical protein